MADIELIVKIPRKVYKAICDKNALGCDIGDIKNIIRNGTPLPKGHGRLKDVDDLDITTITTDDYSGNDVLDVVLKEDLDDAPTIIEADKAESEEI